MDKREEALQAAAARVTGEMLDAGSTPEPTKEELIKQCLAKYNPLIEAAGNQMDRARVVLEMQEELKKIEVDGNWGTITAQSFTNRQLEQLEMPHRSFHKKLRWGNIRPDLHSKRKAQGYRDVKQAGQEVKFGDAVLMEMPKSQYKEEIDAPREAEKARRKGAIENEFHDVGRANRVKTFGEITYDR